MAGRITYRRPVNLTTVIVSKPLRPETLKALEAALGRSLTAREAQNIGEYVDRWRWAHEIADAAVRPDDVRATLRALAASTGDVRHLFAGLVDVTTRALVNSALRIEMRLRIPAAIDPDSDQIRAAARIAIKSFGKEQAGRRETWLRSVAGDALDLWEWLGGPPSRPATNRAGYCTPIVRFAVALFVEAGAPRSASAVAKLLRAN